MFIIGATTAFVSFIHQVNNLITRPNWSPQAYTFKQLFQTSANEREVNDVSVNIQILPSKIKTVFQRAIYAYGPQSKLPHAFKSKLLIGQHPEGGCLIIRGVMERVKTS